MIDRHGVQGETGASWHQQNLQALDRTKAWIEQPNQHEENVLVPPWPVATTDTPCTFRGRQTMWSGFEPEVFQIEKN